MSDHRRGISWKMLIGGIVALLVVTLACGFAWYVSTADLAAVRVLAKQQGIATSWDEFRPGFQADPTRISQFNRLELLTKKLKDYDSELVTGKISGDQKRDCLRPFWPVPLAAREFHANLDQVVVVEALAILDAWPADRMVLSDGNPKNRVRNKFGLYRQMIRWVGERALLADDDQVFVEVRRLLHLVVQMDVDATIDVLCEASLINIVATIVADQLPRLSRHVEELIPLLSHLEGRLPGDVRTGLSGGFIELVPLLEKPGNGTAMGLGLFAEPHWSDSLMNPLRVRAGRAATLEFELERDRQLTTHGLEHGYAQWIQQAKQQQDTLRDWHPGEWLPKLIGSSNLTMDEMILTARLHLQVLIAEMLGGPWPTDLFDPTGKPVRRLTRDGQMIGAYSVGADQKDDGGDQKKDRQFLLFGAWTLPPPPPQP
jgi:hypothetical protein